MPSILMVTSSIWAMAGTGLRTEANIRKPVATSDRPTLFLLAHNGGRITSSCSSIDRKH